MAVKKKRKQVIQFMKVFLITLFLMIILIGIIFYKQYGRVIVTIKQNAQNIVRQSRKETFQSALTSVVYATDGTLLSVLKSEKEVYYIEYNQIPSDALEAMLVTEDKKFFSHHGVDYMGVARAVVALVKNKGEIRQGASTITQQLARNIFLSSEVTYERKIKEIFLAMELEKKYSKKEILEFYFNNMYFANGYYGIQAASYGYFSKSVSELTLSEIAFLCAIPNNPTMHNPLNNFKETMERRDKILAQMFEDNKITTSEYSVATKQSIVLHLSEEKKQNYAETYTYYCAIRALMKEQGFVFRNQFISEEDKQGYDNSYNELYYEIQKTLYTGGYRIYTSIDLEKQALLQKTLDDELSGFIEKNEDGIYLLQGAATCIDNDTGRVVAIIGGREQDVSGYTLNRAYQSYRQPGSSIKPLIVYTPWFERELRPESLVMDEKFDGGPRNSNNMYSGEISIRKAVESSKNTVAWRLFEQLTPKVGLSYLLQMNFKHIVEQDYNPAVSLGGFTYGVSTVEMASAFSTIEYEGMYREPTCIVRITDSLGNVLVKDYVEEKQIYEKNAAIIMTDVLKGVMTDGTGKKLSLDQMPSAGKTGTTNDKKDGWFIGYTKYYTTGVWVGYDYPRAVSDLSGNTYPGRIWKTYMNEIHKELPILEFEPYYEEITTKEDAKETVNIDVGSINENAEQENQDQQTKDDESINNQEVLEETIEIQEGVQEPNLPETDVIFDDNLDNSTDEVEKLEEEESEEKLITPIVDEDKEELIDQTVDGENDETAEEEMWDEEQWQKEEWDT